MTNHILYLSDKRPVCEDPERLGNDFVLNNSGSFPCPDCSALLFTHNKKAYEDELSYNHNHRLHTEDPLAPARGIMWGILIGSVMWILILSALWAITRG